MRAIITGASSGIGEELSRLLAKKQVSLILSGRNEKKLEALAYELKAEKIVVADLREKEDRKKLVTTICQTVPDLVINNAGFGIYGDVLTIPVEDQLSILEVNATAALELTLVSARAMVQAKKTGIILNVSSIAGEYPCPGMSVYGAAKSFLTRVSESINVELEKTGVKVLVSCPGMVTSDFSTRAAKKKVEVPKRMSISVQEAAIEILQQIEKKQEKRIFNWQNRLALMVAKLVPTFLIKKIIWNQIKKRL